MRVFVAIQEGKDVGAMEYRYYEDLNVTITDFTIIGTFFGSKRSQDFIRDFGKQLFGMFSEIYDPNHVENLRALF
jgi:hypothetical protein